MDHNEIINKKKTALFWVITQLVVAIYYRNFGIDMLSRNVRKKLPLYST